MGPSKPPTKAESEWMQSIAELGCIACRKDGHSSPASVHHIISGGRRMGHLFTLPLCYLHHQGDGRQVPSVHFTKKTFAAIYGTEFELLAELQTELDIYDKVTQ